MDKRELLKNMITDFIHDRSEQSTEHLHNYLTTKFQEVSGMSSASFNNDFDADEFDLDNDVDNDDLNV
jgi:hypothetical protein